MKRVLSFLISAVVVIGVLVLFIVFAHHSGPGDSPRDDNNAKSPESSALHVVGGSPGVFARV
jgi:hypothetical protein